ncbi:MAG: hypothetical protein QOF43_1144 [Gaiellaceae bacterium]|nr:hypothetical protein [Gaiellaceae bacterium]
MRRLVPLVALAALSLLAGSARADTFAVLPTQPSQLTLPSFDTPNSFGTVAVPLSVMTPPSAPLQLSYTQLLGVWQRAGASYGVPWQVLAAINKVESNFGRNMGPSSAGAVGWMQFMPSTWFRWGTDATGDGVADPWNPNDAIFSAARYLAATGGSADLYRAVYAYNHADWYVQEVLGLANTFGADGSIAFSLDRMQQNLDAARRAVVDASDSLIDARRAEAKAARGVEKLQARADRQRLLSNRLALEQRAGRIDADRAAAAALVAQRSATLGAARRELVRAEQAASGASFQQGAGQLMGAPAYEGGYVFPVGGGPGIVSASHTHHDYPAVDIAAPMGSPVYALAAGSVVNTWTNPDARCGLGFTYRAFDGQTWTYCHLSFVDPSVTAGALLVAGAPVGLVGMTGHASGPHLHLQLQPASAWPQQEPWFLGFAGTAFTWQDSAADQGEWATVPTRTMAFVPAVQAETAIGAGSGPVFEVVAPVADAPVVLFSR